MEQQGVYFTELVLENIKCFKGRHRIDLSDGKGKPASWTVLLGDNNAGKTTILRCLGGLIPERVSDKITNDATPHYSQPREYNNLYSSESLFDFNGLSQKTIECNLDNFSYGFGITLKGEGLIEYSCILDENLDSSHSSYFFLTYGTSRKVSDISLEEGENIDILNSLYDDKILLTNIEAWLLQLDYAWKNGIESAKKAIEKITEIFKTGIFPEVSSFICRSVEKEKNVYANYVEFLANGSWVRLQDLGSGYQSSMTWVLDMVKRMFERYPDAENPLAMPAVVLVDEIDLHLHPQWQRKIIAFLSGLFPRTQFIVTSHSPLIVQSAENINVVILERQGDEVKIHQPKIPSYEGWSVEEILSELMGLGDKTYSDKYLQSMKGFDEAVANENYELAQSLYEKIVAMVSPKSTIPKILRLQMSSLTPIPA